MVNAVNKGMMGSLTDGREKQLMDEGYSRAATRTACPGGESWQVGDSPVIGLMVADHKGHYTVEGAPRFEYGSCRCLLRPGNPRKIRVYNHVDSRFVLEEFFAKIKYYFG